MERSPLLEVALDFFFAEKSVDESCSVENQDSNDITLSRDGSVTEMKDKVESYE